MADRYVDEAIAGMKTNLYSYLCHPDLFMRGRRVFDEVAKRESIRLCQAAKELHIPLEYNLAGAAYNDIMHTMQYPHIDFWKTAAEVAIRRSSELMPMSRLHWRQIHIVRKALRCFRALA